MRIALDPYMLRTVPLLELPRVVADLGYRHIELSPRDDFMPFFLHPRASSADVAAFKRELAAAEVSGLRVRGSGLVATAPTRRPPPGQPDTPSPTTRPNR